MKLCCPLRSICLLSLGNEDNLLISVNHASLKSKYSAVHRSPECRTDFRVCRGERQKFLGGLSYHRSSPYMLLIKYHQQKIYEIQTFCFFHAHISRSVLYKAKTRTIKGPICTKTDF